MVKRGKVLIVVLFVIVLGNFIFGVEDVELSFPENVRVGDEFDVNVVLKNFSRGVYDVRFDIKNESRDIAERYWDGGVEVCDLLGRGFCRYF